MAAELQFNILFKFIRFTVPINNIQIRNFLMAVLRILTLQAFNLMIFINNKKLILFVYTECNLNQLYHCMRCFLIITER